MKAFFETFFQGLGVQIDSLEMHEEGSDIHLRITTPDSSLLIGIHGKNIESFQHIFSRIGEKKLGKHVHVHLEVNDYMKAKDEKLFRFLESRIEWVRSSGKPTTIKNLSSFERKKAHNYIAEKHIEGLSTKSEGEGENRVLILFYTGELVRKDSPQTITSPEKSKL
jgi:spoIIIJ-associated protein